MIALLLIAAMLALAVARTAVDWLARARHWRVGRWGRVLCIWRRVGESCLACKTDYRYVLAHPIRYTGETRETARAIVPLCQQCWIESPEPERLLAAGVVLKQWRDNGVYGTADAFDTETWDAHRLEVYAAIRAKL